VARRVRSIEEKLRLLELVQERGNILAACRLAGMARSSFYEIKKAYERSGKDGLVPKTRRRPRMPNAFSEEVIRKILEITRKFPSYSCQRIAFKLHKDGVVASGSGVRKIWKRHGLTTCQQRLEAILLSDDPVTRKEKS
jgi:molybdenum-dependent DNA-binding transcriptional regulator ModE